MPHGGRHIVRRTLDDCLRVHGRREAYTYKRRACISCGRERGKGRELVRWDAGKLRWRRRTVGLVSLEPHTMFCATTGRGAWHAGRSATVHARNPRRSRGTTSTLFRAQGTVGTRRGERARVAICDALHAPESARALSSAAVWDANQRAPASCLPASERRARE